MFRPTFFTLALLASAPVMAQAAGETTILRAKVVADGDAEFARVDTNKDGKMSRAEIETVQRTALTARIAARNKALFAELDTDKNGQINATEFAKATPVPKADATDVLRVDTNKDGQVSLAEHRTGLLDTFNKVDTNKDGILTAAEAQVAFAPR